ncbi:MAG: FemAB family PEP-CTERM system-associated protein [Planctomycetota bacterium]|nr:MAG: FemAB family PEP-CTERM system-associated protein [Planctomycetota bacterium]
MSVVRITEFRSTDRDAWNAYVSCHPESTYFHQLSWKRAVEQAFSHRPIYLMARHGCEVTGLLPLFVVDSVLAGRMIVSLPYATYGGAIADDENVAAVLIHEACSIARRLDACSLELRSLRASELSLPVRRSHATFCRALPVRADEVLGMLPRKARAAARKARETGRLSVDFGEHLVEDVWRLYARSMRRLASPNYPRRFFDAVVSGAPGGTISLLVRDARRPVAGLLSFLHRRTVMPYFVGFDERVEIYGLSQFLYSESMRWGVENGFDMYDFGRSRIDNVGAFAFKKLCGFEPQVLEYQDYVLPGRAAPDLAPTSARWHAARRVWRLLPLGVTRPLGAWLARSIPG